MLPKGKCICMLKMKFCVASFWFLAIVILFVFVFFSIAFVGSWFYKTFTPTTILVVIFHIWTCDDVTLVNEKSIVSWKYMKSNKKCVFDVNFQYNKNGPWREIDLKIIFLLQISYSPHSGTNTKIKWDMCLCILNIILKYAVSKE
jgi:energy-coupling factor transporter transmembrane protein EcfT